MRSVLFHDTYLDTPSNEMPPVFCYLDYDGVLHSDSVYLGPGRQPYITRGEFFEWAPFLIEALQPWPAVRIVLSTSWVRVLGFDRAKSALPPTLRDRVVGATFHRKEHGLTPDLERSWLQLGRGLQVRTDAQRRGAPAWIAIDDAVSEFEPEESSNLVACQSDSGLASPSAQKCLKLLLERKHSEANWTQAR